MKTYHGHIYRDIKDKFEHLEEFGDINHNEENFDDPNLEPFSVERAQA